MEPLNKEIIQQHIIDFSNIFGIDLIKEINETESKPQPLGELVFKRDVFGAYKLAEEGKLLEAIVTLNEEIVSYVENIRLDKFDSEKKSIIINIKSREQLQELFGLDYDDIPEWLKLYKSHQFLPYHGNSILDNVDPLALVNDRLSEDKSNGLTIEIKMCGCCYRRLLKKYKIADRTLITFDMKTNKIISLKPNDGVTNNDDSHNIKY